MEGISGRRRGLFSSDPNHTIPRIINTKTVDQLTEAEAKNELCIAMDVIAKLQYCIGVCSFESEKALKRNGY